MTVLSNNFNLKEFLRSQTAERRGIDMTPSMNVRDNLRDLCQKILQPLRDHIKKPISITSGYRPKELNRIIGSSDTSQHVKGEAADFVVHGLTPYEVCEMIDKSMLPFDQCINEFNKWVHVSISDNPRKQMLTAYREGGKVKYKAGLYRLEDLR